MMDSEGRKQLVYCVSHSLIKVHQRYPPMDKAEFTIKMASKTLRHYFGTHKRVVLTSHLLKNILGKLEHSDRLIKYPLSLTILRFNISYNEPSMDNFLLKFSWSVH